MMEIPTRDQLVKLGTHQGKYSVSIFMPINRKGHETRQNPTRLKNLLREAARKIEALGGSAVEAQKQLFEASMLHDNDDFFADQSDGLALFISPDGSMQKFRVPMELTEHVHVNDRFHLKPLMALFQSNNRFYVLAISQKNMRLLAGDRYELKEIPLPKDTPRSMEEAMKYEDWGRGHHLSPGSQGRYAGGIQPFGGHGADASDQESAKNEMRQFLQMVNKGVMEAIGKEGAPLILGGLEYVHPLAREAMMYPHTIKDKGIVRLMDDLRMDELHAMAWEIVEPMFHRAQDAAVDRFNEFRTKGLASSNLSEVVPAAVEGRVETLLVSANEHCWGTFERDTRKVRVEQDEKSAGGEDLLDLAAMQALMNGAEVFSVGIDEMPQHASVAAVFRY